MNLGQKFEVRDWLSNAKGIAWDTCHKIYILMDDTQMSKMRGYGYDPLISAADMSADHMLDTVIEWYKESCGLKFIQAVGTFENGEEDFHEIIGQFNDTEEEEE